jgi:tetratricopeptide (TPR) repeat protein
MRYRPLTSEEKIALECGTATPWLQAHACEYIKQLERDLDDWKTYRNGPAVGILERETASIFSLHRGPLASRRLYKQATIAYEADNRALAARLYRESFEADRDNVQALIMLGCCHYKLDDITTATGLLREAITLAPFDPAAHYYLGMCRAQAGEYRRAVLCYQRAVQFVPSFFEAWFALSLAYDRLDLHRESLESMAKFDEHAPSAAKRFVKEIYSVK